MLLNFYLKYGVHVWDVLKDIKRQDPDLPVIIVTLHGNHLYNPDLDQADGYLINNCLAPVELKQKITALLRRNHIFKKTGAIITPYQEI